MIHISFNDYVKYITQQITSYIDTPSDEKKTRRLKSKDEATAYSSKWLGVVPLY
ncbi:YqzE family protein [Lentibacillus amyloliquefaciens]|uniref:YqzE family protein n=1 Tax=Lentibacillus amyloliquefaciens TaxID=1472767 RepID=UPI001F2CB01A|nr:YqzE family protein [Lentibacillus amyloliquefaciens]